MDDMLLHLVEQVGSSEAGHTGDKNSAHICRPFLLCATVCVNYFRTRTIFPPYDQPAPLAHTLSGEVSPLSKEWERLPGMQRMITLDGVIYVHENPKRRRRRPVIEEPVLEVEIEERHGDYAEPSADWSPEPVVVAEAGVEEQVVVAAAEVESESDFESESEPEPVHVSEAPASWPAAVASEPEPAPAARRGRNTRTIVRSAQVAPPPGYAIEFGTGRLVKIHSYKGRMTYPSSGH